MKVIGTAGDGKYLCEVSHKELEKLTNKYYGNLTTLKVGGEMDLGAGYDFNACIKNSCNQMQEAMQSFKQSQEMLTRFAIMVANLPDTSQAEDA